MGLFKCSLSANCGNTMFVQCSFSEKARRGGSGPSYLGIEAIEDVIEAVRRPVSRVLSPARERADGWPFIWDARRRTPRATYPDGGAETRPIETDLPSLLGLAPGGVCRAAPVAGGAVRSYRTLSPLPGPKAGRFAFCGTFPRVAPAGRYPAPCFRGARTFLPPVSPRRTGRRPSGHLALFR